MPEVEELFSFIQSRTNLERSPGLTRAYRLDRMEALMGELGQPSLNIPAVHVAGSKGKGSTVAFLTALFRGQGYRVGQYTSPHILDFRERIRVFTREEFDLDPLFLKYGNRLKTLTEDRAQKGVPDEDLPTTFELLTALAFLVFQAQDCDVVVLETGLGGRLDATNVCSPTATVITAIELEHTDYLGDTIEAIAAEKAGIVKPGVPLVLAPQPAVAERVIRQTAVRKDAPVYALAEFAAFDNPETRRDSNGDLPGTAVSFTARLNCDEPEPVRAVLPVIGRKQEVNLAVALLAFVTVQRGRLAKREKVPTLQDLVDTALPYLDLSGRGEICSYRGSRVILDGAHTPASVFQLVASLRELQVTPVHLVFSAVEGKNTVPMARELVQIAASVTITRAGTFKKSDPPALAEVFRSLGVEATVETEPKKALERAIHDDEPDTPVLVTGSFYLVAEIKALVVQS